MSVLTSHFAWGVLQETLVGGIDSFEFVDEGTGNDLLEFSMDIEAGARYTIVFFNQVQGGYKVNLNLRCAGQTNISNDDIMVTLLGCRSGERWWKRNKCSLANSTIRCHDLRRDSLQCYWS